VAPGDADDDVRFENSFERISTMTSTDTPDFEDLVFYRQLIEDQTDLYSKAHQTCSFMIIPQNLPSSGKLVRDVFESHLFAPSPLYKNKHASLNDKYEIELENNQAFRLTNRRRGAGERSIKILSQEIISSSQNRRSYTIIVIDQPLVELATVRSSLAGRLSRVPSNPVSMATPKFNCSSATYDSAYIYLDSLRPLEEPFQRLQKDLFLFNEKFIILPNYLDKAIEKLRELRTVFLQESYRILDRRSEDRDIELASEIFVTGNTYTKFWPVILQLKQYAERKLFDNIRRRQLKNEQNPSDQRTMPLNQSASNEMRKLDDLKTAYEKAKCIRSVLDSILANKTIAILDRQNTTVTYRPGSDSMYMAADETLTALIDFICQYFLSAKHVESIHLVAHEFYTDKFRCLSLPPDIAYAFTTFQGALEYLSNNESCS